MEGYPSPHAWAMARVGEYMQAWGMAESALDRAIRAALSLNLLQGLIITAELMVAAKIKIAIAAVHASDIPDKERPKYLKRLNEFLNLTADRNMVAHRAFFISESNDSVSFFVHRLKAGPLEASEVTWTDEDFERRYARLWRIRDKLVELPERIKGLALASMLQQLNEPRSVLAMPYNATQGLAGLGTPLPLKSPSSTPPAAKPRRSPQTRKAPGETKK